MLRVSRASYWAKCSKTNKDMAKGHQSQPEGIPTGQSWSKLSVKMHNDRSRL